MADDYTIEFNAIEGMTLEFTTAPEYVIDFSPSPEYVIEFSESAVGSSVDIASALAAILAGQNVTIDRSIPNQITINSIGGGSGFTGNLLWGSMTEVVWGDSTEVQWNGI